MPPDELRSLAAGHVSLNRDEVGNETISISNEEISLSPQHTKQFDELVGKLLEKGIIKEKPAIKKVGRLGAHQINAKVLVEILEHCSRSGVQLDDPV
jgi:hypothetical protein